MRRHSRPLDPDKRVKAPAPELDPTIKTQSPLGRDSISAVGMPDEKSNSIASIAYTSQGLLEVEAARASTIGGLYAIICGACILWLPFLKPTAPERNIVFGGTLAAMFFMSIFVWRRSKDPDKYTPRLFRTYGAVAVCTSISALIYLGPFSPTALAVTLGIGFFGQSADRQGALAICGVAIVLCGMLMFGVVFQLFPDIGVFKGTEAERSGMLFMSLMVPLILLVTLLQARWSQLATKQAMTVAVSSAMNIKLKNVQLEEAQAELERLFGAEGLAGQYTGKSINEFQLGPLLGRGASGEVYDAIENNTGRRYALKLLLGQDAGTPAMIARFQREGEISMGIASKHVARVNRLGTSEDGVLYIVMERLEGADLAKLLRERGRLSLQESYDMVRHVCRGLQKAHERGVIHRDVKPHNIFLHRTAEQKGVWKVLDFGISKWAGGNATITKLGGVVGTPRYMSPEQARGEKVDHRSDLYSLGSVLYRCLTGLPPYSIGGLGALSAAAFQRPVKPGSLASTLPPQVEEVLALAMAPDPRVRFQSAAEMAKAFSAAMKGDLDPQLRRAAAKVEWGEANS